MPRYLRLGVWVLLFGAALVLGLANHDERVQVIAIQTFMLAALATSWNILGGFAGQISLGHAVFFGLGSLITRELWLGGTHLVPALIMAVVVTGLAAFVVGGPMLRLRGIYFAIGTLALGVAVWVTIGNVRPLTTTLPLDQLRAFTYDGPYFLTLGILVVSVLVASWLKTSRPGLGMMAVRDDEGAAAATGVNPLRHKQMAFVISAGLAALAGGSFAYSTIGYYPNYPFGVTWTFDAILVVFLGGLGTIVGPLVGASFFVIGRDIIPETLIGLQPVVFGVLFILVVLMLPGGIVEGWQRIFRSVSPRGAPPPKQKTGESTGKELV